MIAAMATLRVTTENGGNSLTATPTKKKEPPHNTERIMSIAHTLKLIVRLMDVVIVGLTLRNNNYF